MANAAEVLDSLKEFRKETNRNFRDAEDKNDKAHDGIKTRLDEMNGTQRAHAVRLQTVESTQATHEGKHGIADHERLSLKKRLDAVATTKTATAVIVGGVVTIVTLVLELVKHLTSGGAT